MLVNDFQQACERTWNTDQAPKEEWSNAALGLAGEAGEVVDYLKKVLFHGHTMDGAKLAKELGDVLFYTAILATLGGYSLAEVMQMNIDKLKARYPDGFTTAASVNRKE